MDWDERKEKIRVGGLLEVIREDPVLYLGDRSLSALWHYLQGYWMALSVYDMRLAFPLPPDFQDWVAYRLHFFESTSGYRNMILKRVPDENAALDRFFELLDDHRRRKPHLVATLRCSKEFTRHTVGRDGHTENEQTPKIPSLLKLIAYTDDPGLFVMADDPDADYPRKNRFFPTLKFFGMWYGGSKDDLAILDADTFSRWLSEENRFASRDYKDSPQA